MPSDSIKLDGDPKGLLTALDRAVKAWNAYNTALATNAKAMNLTLDSSKAAARILQDYATGARAAANQQYRLNRSVRSAKKEMDGAAAGTQNLATKSDRARAKADALASSLLRVEKRSKAAQSNVLKLGVSISGMARLVGVQLIHRAISGLVRALSEGVRQSIELQKGLAEIRTISQSNQLTTDQWFAGVKQLSNAYGVDMKDQVEATYQALSNQIAEGADAFTFLADANDFAAASVSTTAEAVNLLTGALNAYGLGAESTNRVAAQFFKTIELGRVRASEMANSIGDIAPLAKQAGIGLDELQAAISTLTINGVSYNKAATQLRGIFVKLIKPTKAMKGFFREIGVESGEAAIRTYGFDGVLQRLQNSTKGSATELGKYINRVRGLSGAMILTNEGLDKYRSNLDEIRDSSESYGKAVDEVMNNSGKRAEIFFNRMKTAALSFGATFVETWTGILGANSNFYEEAERQRKAAHRAESATKQADELNEAYALAIKERSRFYEQDVAKYRSAMNKQVDASIAAYTTIRDAAADLGDRAVENISESIRESSSQIEELSEQILDANKRIVGLVRDEDRTLFEWAQDTRNTAEQIAALTGRIAEQQAKRDEALQQRNKKSYDEYNQTILKLIKERRSLDNDLSRDNIKALEAERDLVKQIAAVKHNSLTKVAALEAKLSGLSGRGNSEKRKAIQRKILEETQKTFSKVTELKAEQSELVTLDQIKIQHARDLTAEVEKQRQGYERIATVNKTIINQERQKIVDQELLKESLKSLVDDFKSFDIGEAAGISDPTELKEVIVQRQQLGEKLLKFQSERGVRSKELLGLGKAAAEETGVLLESLGLLEQVETRRKKIAELEKDQIGFAEKLKGGAEDTAASLRLKLTYENVRDALNALGGVEFNTNFRQTLTDIALAMEGLYDKKGSVQDATETFKEITNLTKNISGHQNPAVGPLRDTIGKFRLELSRVKKDEDAINKSAAEYRDLIEESKEKVKKLEKENKALLKLSRQQIKPIEVQIIKVDKLIERRSKHLELLKKETEELKKQAGSNGTTAVPEQQAFGSVMRGSDNILALRQAGETVMNAKSSRKFYSQLVAMNASPQSVVTQPTGGTTIGDINVTMNASGNLGYDAAALGKSIKRAARRGLV